MQLGHQGAWVRLPAREGKKIKRVTWAEELTGLNLTEGE